MADKDPVAFSFDQQAAFLGHALQTPSLWNRYDAAGVTKDWFLDERNRAVFETIATFRTRHRRPPSADEIVAAMVAKDPMIRAAAETRVRICAEAAVAHRTDILLPLLSEWAILDLAKHCALEIKERHDRGLHLGIEEVISSYNSKIARMKLAAGSGGDTFVSAPDRLVGEEEERIVAGRDKLRFGISFFDDALGGIYRHDLILATSRSGAGKTQQATIVAETNAADHKRVWVFGLEAADKEWERRIIYRKLIELWLAGAHDKLARWPTWRAWFRGEIWAIDTLKTHREEAEAWFNAAYPTLKTYYKKSSKFGIEELERKFLEIKDDADLVIVDHFDYVEMKESESANREANRLITLFRDLSVGSGVPFYVIVHINKEGDSVLVPDQQHIMGSSDIYKKGTTVLTAAPAHDIQAGAEVRGKPTYQRVAKDRVGGSLPEIGCGFFDNRTGSYSNRYAAGYLNLGNTSWKGLKVRPDWSKEANFIAEVSISK